MNNLRRELAKIPGESGVHIVNGMLYEAYFDHEGKFREGELKDKYLSKLFELETVGKAEKLTGTAIAALKPGVSLEYGCAILTKTRPEWTEETRKPVIERVVKLRNHIRPIGGWPRRDPINLDRRGRDCQSRRGNAGMKIDVRVE